jgi:hypothetical protein
MDIIVAMYALASLHILFGDWNVYGFSSMDASYIWNNLIGNTHF